jgi:hypothetical protein
VRTIPDKIFANIVCNTLKMSEVAPWNKDYWLLRGNPQFLLHLNRLCSWIFQLKICWGRILCELCTSIFQKTLFSFIIHSKSTR